jgi:hypothetical protein
MRRFQGWAWIIVLAVAVWGCNKSEQPAPENAAPESPAGDPPQKAEAASSAAPAVKLEGPKLTVYEFLEALRTGNDDKANLLLSAIAREKTAAMDFRLTPSASDTAKFTIDEAVDYRGEDGARVAMTWTDVDVDGNATSDRAVWVLRKEPEGWRIVGTAAMFFPGEDPVVLNFEDPAEVKKKLKEVSDRMNGPQESGGAENLQAEQPNPPENAIRR